MGLNGPDDKKDQAPREAILKNSIEDAFENLAAKGVSPEDPAQTDFLNQTMARFGSGEDATEFINSLIAQGDQKLIEQLKRGDVEGILNGALIDELQKGGIQNERFLIAASESPLDIVALVAVSSLISLKSEKAAKQMEQLLSRPNLGKEILLAALETIEAIGFRLSKKLITPLTELKEHADPEVSEVVGIIFKTIDSERAIIQAAKKMKNLFEKLKPDGDHALSAEDEQLRQLILKMLKKKPD